MNTSRAWIAYEFVGAVVFGITMFVLGMAVRTLPPPPKAAVVAPVEPGHDVLCLGETPEGARIYRVSGPKAIVPATVVVGPGANSVAIR